MQNSSSTSSRSIDASHDLSLEAIQLDTGYFNLLLSKLYLSREQSSMITITLEIREHKYFMKKITELPVKFS